MGVDAVAGGETLGFPWSDSVRSLFLFPFLLFFADDMASLSKCFIQRKGPNFFYVIKLNAVFEMDKQMI